MLLRIVLAVAVLAVVLPMGRAPTAQAAAPTEAQVKLAIANGVAWLAGQQNADGFWGTWEVCGVTALAVKKLEHHAVDPKWGLGLHSPFDLTYPYHTNVEKGFQYLFDNCVSQESITTQDHGNPDSDGDGKGVVWGTSSPIYTTGIGLMTVCEAVDLGRTVASGPLAGQTYGDVARDTMDYLAFAQNENGTGRGGWRYSANSYDSDESVTGYVSVGLAYAKAAPPEGCGFTVPQFVKDELNVWVGYIQSPDGGSGYTDPGSSNILRTGNLLQQMAFLGDNQSTPRVVAALGYMAAHWADAGGQGWEGAPTPAAYQATFTTMKGMTALGIEEFGSPPIDWQTDFETVLLAQQNGDGSWPTTSEDFGGNRVLSTIWALLTLQKVAPPPTGGPIGGIVGLPALSGTSGEGAAAPSEGSGWSAGGYAALAGVGALALMAIAAGGWYTRRRLLR